MEHLIPALIPAEKLENDSYDWYQRHAEKCVAAAEKQYDIVLIGDSITHFWETTHGPESYRRLFGHRRVLNLGFGWDRTCNVLWRLKHGELKWQEPKAVILHIGTNNFSKTEHYPGDSAPEIALGILGVVAELRKTVPQSKIAVMGVFQRGYNPSFWREPVREVNAILQNTLPAEAEFINISEKFLLPDGSDLDPAAFRPGDQTHLSEEGYARWAAALELFFKKTGL